MTTAAKRPVQRVPLGEADLPWLVEVEKTAYAYPWAWRHWQDSLRQGHWVQALVTPLQPHDPPSWQTAPALADGRRVLAYMAAMAGFEETHLLNITTVPMHQRQGWAGHLLADLGAWSRAQGAQQVWLEVRQSNAHALALYQRHGFEPVSVRKGYYPNGHGPREDAVVMCWRLEAQPGTRPPNPS